MAALLLLADSQLLFREPVKTELSLRIQHCLGSVNEWSGRAAYIGAANNNEASYFALARDAFSAMLPSLESMTFIRSEGELPAQPCRLVILAGGSVTAGWAFLKNARVQGWLEACFNLPDCVIVGVSAGAIHLARGCDSEQDQVDREIQTYLGWLDRVVAVHEEKDGWPTLQLARKQCPQWPQLGIATAGGIWIEKGQLSKLGFGAVIVSPT